MYEKLVSMFFQLRVYLLSLWKVTPEPSPVAAPPSAREPEPEPAPAPAAPPPAAAPILVVDPRVRELERRRRKFDKFVTPKGPTPAPNARSLRRNRPRKKERQFQFEEIDEIVADYHHEGDGKEKVLYTDTEIGGSTFSFRDTILEQLESYSVYIKRMRKKDPDAYEFYKRVGANVVPYSAVGLEYQDLHEKKPAEIDTSKYMFQLPVWFKTHRPGFGCITIAANPLGEKVEQNSKYFRVKFMYFIKYKQPPPELQPMGGGDIYGLTVWWDKPWDRNIKHGVPQEFGIFVSADGTELKVLRVLKTKFNSVRCRRPRGRRSDRQLYTKIPERAWHLPKTYEDWASDHNLSADRFLIHVFCSAMSMYERTNYSMIRVAAKKNNITAVFGVDVKRTAYFFKDRDITLNVQGHKRRIFHIVRPHERVYADGHKVPIKMHFRGLRMFEWAGYQVMITVPGKDHPLLQEYEGGASDEYWLKGEQWYSQKQFGEIIADSIEEDLRAVVSKHTTRQ